MTLTNTMRHSDDMADGSLLLIDKPLHWTSFDVVKKIRGLLKIKKVGHAGTLDPLATGLLLVCTGKKTKMLNGLVEMEKTYLGILELGKATPSVDLETDFNLEVSWQHITKTACIDATKRFIGNIDQVPPMHSAVRIEGGRAYEIARKGQTIKMPPRRVVITKFNLTDIALPEISFEICCSKGTYIRSLVRDLGEMLGSAAYLKSLRRTRIGPYDVSQAWSMEELIQNGNLSGN